jgi:hypothetical protein
MPLIELDPPSIFPRGTGNARPLVLASGSAAYSQLAAGLLISLAKPIGIWDQGWLAGPASSSSTLFLGSADSRFATTAPADPAPTTI